MLSVNRLRRGGDNQDIDLTLGAATSIADNLFYGVTNLKSVSADQVTSIGGHAFYECKALTTVYAANLTSIGKYAFTRCYSLTTVDAESIESVADDCFFGCNSLTTINLSQATTLGNLAFQGCKSLTSLDTSKITTMGHQCFYLCTGLTELDGSNVETVGYRAFYNCNFKTISLPFVTDLDPLYGEDRKFFKYRGGVFESNVSLETVYLPQVTQICGLTGRVDGVYNKPTFKDCTSLKTVVIGANENKEIISTEVCTLSGENAFENTPIANGTGCIYVPDDLVESYKTAENWSTFADQIKPVSELEVQEEGG